MLDLLTAKRAAALLLLAATTATAWATEPLPDRIWYQGRAGTVYQVGKGGLALPPSEPLRALVRAQSCSAMGGPRGVYKVVHGRLWLAGLYTCSAAIGLRDVYPDMLTPPVAQWVSGVLVAQVGKFVCMSAQGRPMHEFDVQLTVEKGAVKATAEKAANVAQCARAPAG